MLLGHCQQVLQFKMQKKNSQKCYKISNYASFEIEFWVRSYSHIMSSGININMVSNDGSMIDYIQSRS